ncbi:MAG: hypothetical protein K6F35_08915 [Lachnospiraceae bacterium]|nr:hypothetical protein [Lachnospiraceae bacterium]
MLTLLSAVFFRRKAEDTLPAVVFLLMILIYMAGILGVIAHVLELTALYFISGSIFFACLLKLGRKMTYVDMAGLCLQRIKSAGLWIYLFLCIFFTVCTLHLRVTNWDDLHYWAIFSRNMAAINGVPAGDMASSLYRDYFPIVQYLYFPVFKLIGAYRESVMFAVDFWLIFLALLPMFARREGQTAYSWCFSVIWGIALPFLCSFQMLHCLGVDIIMTFFFGLGIVWIYDEERDLFYHIRLILLTTALTLTKTTALIFSAVLIGLYFVKNIRRSWGFLASFLILSLSNGCFYISWKAFCRIRGNTTYLSDNLSANISQGAIAFPDYTGDTIRKFLKALFTFPLNGSGIGLSAAAMLLIMLSCYILYLRGSREKTRDILSLTVLMLGMVGYLLVLVYIYLFVFDPWEAESLSSFDRYITTYFGALLYFGLFILCRLSLKAKLVYPVLTALFMLTVNYGYIGETLLPSGFEKANREALMRQDAIEDELKSVFSEDMHYGDHILYVDSEYNMERSKMIPYCSVPYVVRIIWPEKGEGVDPDHVLSEADRFQAKYVIFLDSVKDLEKDWDTDRLYRYDRDAHSLLE